MNFPNWTQGGVARLVSCSDARAWEHAGKRVLAALCSTVQQLTMDTQ